MDIRQSIIEKVEEAQINKLKLKESCDHDWKKYKETVRADNPNFIGDAYFILHGCLKCHEKRRADYIVNR